jgi:hypothetical protein
VNDERDSLLWERAIPDSVFGLGGDAHSLDDLQDIGATHNPPGGKAHSKEGYAVQIHSNSRGTLYWQFRKRGGGKYKPTLPGGKFDDLGDAQRKAAYYENSRVLRERKATAKAARGSRQVGKRICFQR